MATANLPERETVFAKKVGYRERDKKKERKRTSALEAL